MLAHYDTTVIQTFPSLCAIQVYLTYNLEVLMPIMLMLMLMLMLMMMLSVVNVVKNWGGWVGGCAIPPRHLVSARELVSEWGSVYPRNN